MATFDKAATTDSGGGLAFLYDERVRNIFYQVVTFVVVALLAFYLFDNTSRNLEERGMNSGFGFITSAAGFNTDFKLIDYEAGDTYGRIYIVGILNTLFVSVLAIIGATMLGFVMGVARLSSNWMVAKMSAAYVEILRNTPLLFQIIFWYLGVFSLLPRPKQSADIGGMGVMFLNNRGLYGASPIPGELFWITLVALAAGIGGAIYYRGWAKKRQADTGQQSPVFLVCTGLIVGLPLVIFLITGSPLTWEIPSLQGFNLQGGFKVPPAFLALFVALTIYSSAYMAEMVRAGIQSVHKGQTEASSALGLRYNKTLSLVIIPQAMRAIVPPMISLWMNIVKNSSLAVAIGYPDIVALFMQTSLNQSGYAIEIVAMTMLFYMTVSLTISACLNVYNSRVQLKER